MSDNKDDVVSQALKWLEANKDKNKAQSAERKAAEQLKKMVAASSQRTIEVDDKTSILVGWYPEQSEEIDPKKLFERDPKLFWELVSIPKTNCIAAMGDKEAARVMRTKNEVNFRVKKETKK